MTNLSLLLLLAISIGISCIASTASAFATISSSRSSCSTSHHSTALASSSSIDDNNNVNMNTSRRQMMSTSTRAASRILSLSLSPSIISAALTLSPLTASARAPGSKDICASILQIRDASTSLQTLLQPSNWDQYTVVDGEGRAGSTDGARRILGGIAPQGGSRAIDVAKNTPLYRIDVAFVTVRKYVLEGGSDNDDDRSWTDSLDLERFEELADRVVYNVSKSDGNFYSVLFAMKGGKMIEDIFVETRGLVEQGVGDLDEMIGLLKSAGAPCMD